MAIQNRTNNLLLRPLLYSPESETLRLDRFAKHYIEPGSWSLSRPATDTTPEEAVMDFVLMPSNYLVRPKASNHRHTLKRAFEDSNEENLPGVAVGPSPPIGSLANDAKQAAMNSPSLPSSTTPTMVELGNQDILLKISSKFPLQIGSTRADRQSENYELSYVGPIAQKDSAVLFQARHSGLATPEDVVAVKVIKPRINITNKASRVIGAVREWQNEFAVHSKLKHVSIIGHLFTCPPLIDEIITRILSCAYSPGMGIF